MAPQGSSQLKVQCGKFYRTNNLVSSANKWHKRGEGKLFYIKGDLRDISIASSYRCCLERIFKTTAKRYFFDKRGKLNTDWVLDDIKILLFILLCVKMQYGYVVRVLMCIDIY